MLPTNSQFLMLPSSSSALMTKHLSSSILLTCLMMPLSNFLYSTSLMLAILIFLIFLSFRSRLHSSLLFSDRYRIFSCVQNPFSEHFVRMIPFFSSSDRALLSSDSVWFSCEEGSEWSSSSESRELEEEGRWRRSGGPLAGMTGVLPCAFSTWCSWKTMPLGQAYFCGTGTSQVCLGSFGLSSWDFSVMCSDWWSSASPRLMCSLDPPTPLSLNSEPLRDLLETRLEDLDLFSSSISSMPIQVTLLSKRKGGFSMARCWDGFSSSFLRSSSVRSFWLFSCGCGEAEGKGASLLTSSCSSCERQFSIIFSWQTWFMCGLMMSSLCFRQPPLCTFSVSRVLLQSWFELFRTFVRFGGRFKSSRRSQLPTGADSLTLNAPLLRTASKLRAFTSDRSVFFSPDLSASRSQDLSVKRFSEMPLSEGETLACWLKLRKGTCGRPRVLLTMELLSGGGLVVLAGAGGARVSGRATGAVSLGSSKRRSFFLAFLRASWACLRQVAQRQASRSLLNLTITWKTCSPMAQKQSSAPLCSSCCASSIEIGYSRYFCPSTLLTNTCLQSDLSTTSSQSTFLLSPSESVKRVIQISALVSRICRGAFLAAAILSSTIFFSCSRSNSSVLNFSLRVRRQSSTNWFAWTCSSDLLMAFLNLLTTSAAWLWLLTAMLSLSELIYCFMWDSRNSCSEFIGLLQLSRCREEFDDIMEQALCVTHKEKVY